MMLAIIPMLAGCETLSQFFGSKPAEIRPSTWCEIYQPVRAPFDRIEQRAAWDSWWDDLPAAIGAAPAETIRLNNAAYQELCQ